MLQTRYSDFVGVSSASPMRQHMMFTPKLSLSHSAATNTE